MGSIIKDIDSYVALDLETTGYDRDFDRIIECAVIRYDSGREVDRFATLIDPGSRIDSFVEEKTGITNDMLAGAPKTSEALASLKAFIKDDDILLGHALAFDLGFLRANGCEIGNEYIDTMRISRRLWPEEKHHRLGDLNLRLLGGDGSSAHRSADDAAMTAACYEKMREYCHENDIDMFELSKKKKKRRAKREHEVSEDAEIDIDSPFYGRCFVFTGAMERYTRFDAEQLVVDRGGTVASLVSHKINVLVVGTQDYARVGITGKSSKQRKAEELIRKGYDLLIISENTFYEMLNGLEL